MSVRNTRRRFFGIAAAAVGERQSVREESHRPVRRRLSRHCSEATPVPREGWPKWPEWRQAWEPSILEVLRSGKWYRGSRRAGAAVRSRLREAARGQALPGARRASSHGCSSSACTRARRGRRRRSHRLALTRSSPPTTPILINKALPVFADTDPATLTMDPASIESRITERTRAIMPVHILRHALRHGPDQRRSPGSTSWRSSRMPARPGWPNTKAASAARSATWAVSASRTPSTCRPAKAAPITGNSDELLDRCQLLPQLRPRLSGASRATRRTSPAAATTGCSSSRPSSSCSSSTSWCRKPARRRENADYLTAYLKQIPGIQPARLPENSRAVWHLYPFRYDASSSTACPATNSSRRCNAEGIPARAGYQEQYFDGLLDEAIASRGLQAALQRRSG